MTGIRAVSADPRWVPLADGVVSWVFPTLTDPVEVDAVLALLRAVDEQLHGLGGRLGTRPDAALRGVSLNRLMFYRLGPAPEFPTTELWSEGGSDAVFVFVRLWVPRRFSAVRVGPPWRADAGISLRCEVDPMCAGHEVEGWSGPPVDTLDPGSISSPSLQASPARLEHIKGSPGSIDPSGLGRRVTSLATLRGGEPPTPGRRNRCSPASR